MFIYIYIYIYMYTYMYPQIPTRALCFFASPFGESKISKITSSNCKGSNLITLRKI